MDSSHEARPGELWGTRGYIYSLTKHTYNLYNFKSAVTSVQSQDSVCARACRYIAFVHVYTLCRIRFMWEFDNTFNQM